MLEIKEMFPVVAVFLSIASMVSNYLMLSRIESLERKAILLKCMNELQDGKIESINDKMHYFELGMACKEEFDEDDERLRLWNDFHPSFIAKEFLKCDRCDKTAVGNYYDSEWNNIQLCKNCKEIEKPQ